MSDDLPPEPVGVSPRIDCVFHRLLGDPKHVGRLLDFLNAILDREVPIVDAEVLNPLNLAAFVGDRSLAIDVKAVDAAGHLYQIEMQSWNEAALKARILFNWADLYRGQLGRGDGYDELKPVIAIWMLDENILRGPLNFHHRFVPADLSDGTVLHDHLEIHTLEIEKWRTRGGVASPAVVRWMSFFAEGETWSEVPSTLRSPALEEAMAVLKEFRNNAELNELYRARLDGMRRQKAQDNALAHAVAEWEQERAAKEQERAAKEQALAAEERERAAKEQALAEVARLRALLGRSSDDAP